MGMQPVIDAAVVSENPFIGRIVAEACKAFGVSIVCNTSTLDEFEEVEVTFDPDVLIVALNANKTKQLQWIVDHRLKEGAHNPFRPIIAVSASGNIKTIRASIAAGVNEFVVLPISAVRLSRAIASAMNAKRQFIRTNRYFGPCRRRLNDTQYEGPDRRKAASAQDTARAAGVNQAPARQADDRGHACGVDVEGTQSAVRPVAKA